ncbi:DinB family protein [Mycolicibacterium smegmatis]|uniref:DinB family protein n=1 Tax=Mycolicibacterium smegmatis TaxID=1772 RepID=UPI0005D8D4EC|nr:DinB family protein [Mycolicibacterium smegmatis]MDF1899485.1 DinB family protein [Mycolicibacterium smegmatis]MDF1905208.1 DinB family protein [Mycolicibacterium smegmatis]MDF1918804.1 DinB family protein [Mycolicibacterium smegmatis]MDF1924226.1 DinB family protein [Mycolicibacterium smegmatis]UGT75466.1 DinB family protein [Mycolicibacterium smegmatis]
MPPLNGDERTTLVGWLDFYRATLAAKCEGLTDEQVRIASVEPSEITLLGLVQHAAEVERNWFRRVLTGEQLPPIFGSTPHPEGHDSGFELSPESSYRAAITIWQDEIRHAPANIAERELDDTSPFMQTEVTLRWIVVHMIAEYARHCGHADLIRERIDGRTGV